MNDNVVRLAPRAAPDEAARSLRTIGMFTKQLKTPPLFIVEPDGRIVTDNGIEAVYCRSAADARAALKGAGFEQRGAWWFVP